MNLNTRQKEQTQLTMPAEIPCNGLCLVGGKGLVTSEMNVTLNIVI